MQADGIQPVSGIEVTCECLKEGEVCPVNGKGQIEGKKYRFRGSNEVIGSKGFGDQLERK